MNPFLLKILSAIFCISYVFHQPVAINQGSGKNRNNSYGPITIGPNGKAYAGVFNGLISIEDTVAE